MPDFSDISEVSLPDEFSLKDDFPVPDFMEWLKVVEKDLKGVPFEKLITNTYEQIPLNPIYTQKDINHSAIQQFPGFHSFLRNNNASGSSFNEWLYLQELPFGDADEFNDALLKDLQNGGNAVVLSPDKATKKGLDADFAHIQDIGEGGVSISALNSISKALNKIDLSKYPIFIHSGASSLSMLCLFNYYLEKTGRSIDSICGAIDADPIGYLLQNGSLPTSLEVLFNHIFSSANWIKLKKSKLKTTYIDGAIFTDAGANAIQELSFSFAIALKYIEEMCNRGLSLKDAVNSISFNFGVTSFFFMEIAKMRAARVVWSSILKELGMNENEIEITFFASNSKSNKTIHDPYTNLLRNTAETFSAIMGGVSGLTVHPFDLPYGIPSEFARRLSRNVHIILREESNFGRVIDPAGGSYFVESLTNQITENVFEALAKIEANGGILDYISSGKLKSDIDDTVKLKKKDINKRKRVIVGTNMYPNISEELLQFNKNNKSELKEKRSNFLQKFRTSGTSKDDSATMNTLLSIIDAKAEDLPELVTDAYKNGATLGEISKSLFIDYESYFRIEKLNLFRESEEFELLRRSSANHKVKTGYLPSAFLANFGPLKQHKIRADFSKGFLEIAGIKVSYSEGFINTENAVKAADESNCDFIVICSTDDTYPEIVPEFCKLFKEKSEKQIILAGYPKEYIDQFKEAGIDNFIFMGADAFNLLKTLFQKAGVELI